MSGVYISGMEMPISCFYCALQTDYGTCGYYSYYIEGGHDCLTDARRDDCPLIEVPTHGRLIDADVLYETLDGGFDVDMGELPETKAALLEMIASAETIIPKEDENERG